MKNEKGFTLVELLAVVALLSVIMLIAVPAVLSFTTRMKKDMYCNKVDTVIKSAQLMGTDNMQSIVNGNLGNSSDDKCLVNGAQIPGVSCVKTTVEALLLKNYLTKEAVKKGEAATGFYDPRDGAPMMEDYVFIYIKNKRAYAAYVFNEKEDAELCNGVYWKDGATIKQLP